MRSASVLLFACVLSLLLFASRPSAGPLPADSIDGMNLYIYPVPTTDDSDNISWNYTVTIDSAAWVKVFFCSDLVDARAYTSGGQKFLSGSTATGPGTGHGHGDGYDLIVEIWGLNQSQNGPYGPSAIATDFLFESHPSGDFTLADLNFAFVHYAANSDDFSSTNGANSNYVYHGGSHTNQCWVRVKVNGVLKETYKGEPGYHLHPANFQMTGGDHSDTYDVEVVCWPINSSKDGPQLWGALDSETQNGVTGYH